MFAVVHIHILYIYLPREDKCYSVVDVKCDQVGPYQLCGKQYPKEERISSTCNDSPVEGEGK